MIKFPKNKLVVTVFG